MSAGIGFVVVPTYIYEISPPGMRGPLGTITQVQIMVGLLIVFTLGIFLPSDEVVYD